MTRERVRELFVPAILCAAFLGALLLLTANVDRVALGPGHPTLDGTSLDRAGTRDRTGWTMDFKLARHLLFVAFTVSLAIVIAGALSTKLLRRWLYFTVGLLGALVVFDLFSSRLSPTPHVADDGSAGVASEAPPQDAQPAAWTDVLIAIGVSLSAGAIVIVGLSWTARRWRVLHGRRREKPLAEALEELAVESLRAPHDADLVVRCYQQMVDLLSHRGHLPHGALTAREFADRVRGLGFRSAAIDRLTELFELVRYGHRDSRPFAVRALRSLDEIRTVPDAAVRHTLPQPEDRARGSTP